MFKTDFIVVIEDKIKDEITFSTVLSEKVARELLSRAWRKRAVGRVDMSRYTLGYHPVHDNTQCMMLHSVPGEHIPTWIPVRQLG